MSRVWGGVQWGMPVAFVWALNGNMHVLEIVLLYFQATAVQRLVLLRAQAWVNPAARLERNTFACLWCWRAWLLKRWRSIAGILPEVDFAVIQCCGLTAMQCAVVRGLTCLVKANLAHQNQLSIADTATPRVQPCRLPNAFVRLVAPINARL